MAGSQEHSYADHYADADSDTESESSYRPTIVIMGQKRFVLYGLFPGTDGLFLQEWKDVHQESGVPENVAERDAVRGEHRQSH